MWACSGPLHHHTHPQLINSGPDLLVKSPALPMMGPYEAAFFYEHCRLSGDPITPYRPIHPEIGCTVRAVSEMLAEEGLSDDVRAVLLRRIADRIHNLHPVLDEQMRRRRVERQLQRSLKKA